jgi:long-chain acyl-CoA synthetase
MYRTLIDVIQSTFRKHSRKVAYSWREKKDIKTATYLETSERVKKISAALIDMGVKPGDKVALIADVSYYWILGNLSIQNITAVDVPRGTDSTGDELAFILSHSEASIVMIHTSEHIEKIEKALAKQSGKKITVKKYIVLQGPKGKTSPAKQLILDELIEKGERLLAHDKSIQKEIDNRHKNVSRDTIASIIYTSGTTGQPKGVMLTHGNFASQMNVLPGPFDLSPADRMLTLLPPWHVFGRILEYIFFEAGATIYYTDIKNMGDDMKRVKPTYVPAVPRVWEGVYNKIMAGVKKGGKEPIFNFFKKISLLHFKAMKIILDQDLKYRQRNIVSDILIKLASFLFIGLLVPFKALGYILVFKKILAATGGKLRGSISGGGALPGYIDEFFAASGINIYEGYGLTETTPVLAVRLPGNLITGTVGPAVPMTQIKIITMEGKDVTGIPGEKGTLYVKGPQIMAGYYKNPEKTAEVLDRNGWLNTGDLVKLTMNGHISIVGRSKDTIVLRGGENVEPVPIEEKIKESPYVDQVMLVGQDEKSIGALIVTNLENLTAYCQNNNISVDFTVSGWEKNHSIISLIGSEIHRLNSSSAGFKSYERVSKFRILTKPFEAGDELSSNFKVKRHVVTDKYSGLISEIYEGEH